MDTLTAVIARRLHRADGLPLELEPHRLALRRALESDYDEVRVRFDMLSTGEQAVAAAFLHRCDYSYDADQWTKGGFFSLLRSTSGDHLKAVVALLGR